MITFRRLGRLGRFGNQLFQYAGTRLYAQLHGFDYRFPRWEGLDVFQLEHTPLPIRYRLLPTLQLEDMRAMSVRAQILERFGWWRKGSLANLYEHPKNNINLYGYLQEDRAIEKLREHRDLVRSWFQFRKEIDDKLRKATEKYRPWCAVHIRRGDLVQRGLVVPVERYQEVLPSVLGQRNLYIASDDPAAGAAFQNRCPFGISYADFDIPPWAIDFWMLVHADVLLAGGSTFAWWGAFLGTSDYYAPPLTHTREKDYVPRLEKQIL